MTKMLKKWLPSLYFVFVFFFWVFLNFFLACFTPPQHPPYSAAQLTHSGDLLLLEKEWSDLVAIAFSGGVVTEHEPGDDGNDDGNDMAMRWRAKTKNLNLNIIFFLSFILT